MAATIATAGRLMKVPVVMMWWPDASKFSGAEANTCGNDTLIPVQLLIMASSSLK